MTEFYRQTEAQEINKELEITRIENLVLTGPGSNSGGAILALLGRKKEMRCQITALKQCKDDQDKTIDEKSLVIVELKHEIARLNQETAIRREECEKLESQGFAYFQETEELKATLERCEDSYLWQCNINQSKTIKEQIETIKDLEDKVAELTDDLNDSVAFHVKLLADSHGNKTLRECNANQAKMIDKRDIEIKDLALDNKGLRANNTGLGMRLSNQKDTITTRDEQIAKLEDRLKKRKQQLYMILYKTSSAQTGLVKEVVERVLEELRGE